MAYHITFDPSSQTAVSSTDEDFAIFDRIGCAVSARNISEDRHAAEIMHARTLATLRGATPAEIQHNVMALESDFSDSECFPDSGCLGH